MHPTDFLTPHPLTFTRLWLLYYNIHLYPMPQYLRQQFNIYRYHKLRRVIRNIQGGDPYQTQRVGDRVKENETQLATANGNSTESELPFILSNDSRTRWFNSYVMIRYWTAVIEDQLNLSVLLLSQLWHHLVSNWSCKSLWDLSTK